MNFKNISDKNNTHITDIINNNILDGKLDAAGALTQIFNEECAKAVIKTIAMEENKMIPTYEEYRKAKEITDQFEAEQRRLADIMFNNFRSELEEYFKNNLVDGIRVEEFSLRKIHDYYEINIVEPFNEFDDEEYDGSNDVDIKKICDKYGIQASFPNWMYCK